jgi:hypothetical protein
MKPLLAASHEVSGLTVTSNPPRGGELDPMRLKKSKMLAVICSEFIVKLLIPYTPCSKPKHN